MGYWAKFRLGISGKERIKEYKTAREAREAAAQFMGRHGARGYAEYLGRGTRQQDRSNIKFVLARRNERGILIVAHYQTPNTTEGKRRYRVGLWIDPSTKGILSVQFSLVSRHRGSREEQHLPEQQEIASEIRDMFLKLPAWELIRNRQADWFTAVSSQGKIPTRGDRPLSLARCHRRKVRADDVDQPIGRSPRRGKAHIFAAGIHEKDETGMVDFGTGSLRWLSLRVIDLVG